MQRPYFIHIGSLILTKTADGLIDPKLVLSWLFNAIGAPGYLVGILVPVREAGSLLPQLALAQRIEASAQRKWFWVAGSAIQGLSAVGMGVAALTLSGAAAGWVIIACLATLAVARSACSASYKDVKARTIEKGERGKVSGTAGTVAAVTVFAFAFALSIGVWPRTPSAIALALILAGALWIAASLLFSRLEEPRADTDSRDEKSLADLVAPLRDDSELQTYIATRALLISTALAPPFLVLLGNVGDSGLGNLGTLMIASSLAAFVSSYIWGAFSDRSSRQTMMVAGGLSAMTFFVAAGSGLLGFDVQAGLFLPILIFVAQIAYQGARAGRKTHLTDMDTDDQKAVYTALSNTVIGVMLILGGAFGVLAELTGPRVVLAVLGLLSLFAIVSATRLSEVQKDA